MLIGHFLTQRPGQAAMKQRQTDAILSTMQLARQWPRNSVEDGYLARALCASWTMNERFPQGRHHPHRSEAVLFPGAASDPPIFASTRLSNFHQPIKPCIPCLTCLSTHFNITVSSAHFIPEFVFLYFLGAWPKREVWGGFRGLPRFNFRPISLGRATTTT